MFFRDTIGLGIAGSRHQNDRINPGVWKPDNNASSRLLARATRVLQTLNGRLRIYFGTCLTRSCDTRTLLRLVIKIKLLKNILFLLQVP